jgi:hypothetical protein
MITQEGGADTRAKIQALVREATVGLEAKLGISLYEYAARKLRPAGLKWDRHARANAVYCFRLLDCGRWLPLNRSYRPLGIGALDGWRGDYEAYADRAVHFPTDPHELVAVWVQRQRHTLYLYNGNPASLTSYYHRFARLAAAMCPWRASNQERPSASLSRI